MSDHEIEDLVGGLDNLRWNLHVQIEIFALGECAVPALVRFLHQPPSQFPDGRVLAAEALGRIGGEAALQGLLSALNPTKLNDLGPVVRLAEEAVQDAVARQLGRMMEDRRSVPTLIESLRASRLIGAAEALVQFHEVSAIPWLIEGLEDAFKRDRFALALQESGSCAIPFLIETLTRRRTAGGEELLPSIERRAKALELLARLGAKEAVPAIRTALGDPSNIVHRGAALAFAALEPEDNKLETVPALLAGLTHPDFLQRDRYADALRRIGLRAIPLIQQALRHGNVTVAQEIIPLTANAREAALALLEQLRDRYPC